MLSFFRNIYVFKIYIYTNNINLLYHKITAGWQAAIGWHGGEGRDEGPDEGRHHNFQCFYIYIYMYIHKNANMIKYICVHTNSINLYIDKRTAGWHATIGWHGDEGLCEGPDEGRHHILHSFHSYIYIYIFFSIYMYVHA